VARPRHEGRERPPLRAEHAGLQLARTLTFTPPVEVLFERIGTEENAGRITNVISDSEHGLLLTFTFAVNLPGAAPGTAEERQKGEAMRESYVGAVKAMLARVRALVKEGKL